MRSALWLDANGITITQSMMALRNDQFKFAQILYQGDQVAIDAVDCYGFFDGGCASLINSIHVTANLSQIQQGIKGYD